MFSQHEENPTPEPQESPDDGNQEERRLVACTTCGEPFPEDKLNEYGDCPDCASGTDEEEDDEIPF